MLLESTDISLNESFYKFFAILCDRSYIGSPICVETTADSEAIAFLLVFVPPVYPS